MCIVNIYIYVQLKNILLFQLLLFLLGGGGVWVLLLSAFSMTTCIWKLLLFYIIECNFKSKSSMILYEYFLSDEKSIDDWQFHFCYYVGELSNFRACWFQRRFNVPGMIFRHLSNLECRKQSNLASLVILVS